MNILIIGNGFDKAFGLPTSYTDFLAFTEAVKNSEVSFKNAGITYPINITENQKTEFGTLIENNKLLQYFNAISNCPTINYSSENWIDFEEELKNIIESLDECYTKDNDGHYVFKFPASPNWNDGKPYGEIKILKFYYFIQVFFPNLIVQYNYHEWKYYENLSFSLSDKRKIISGIYDSFCEFCKLFELYCSEYIKNISIYEPNQNLFLSNPNWRDIPENEIFEANIKTKPQLLPLMGFDKVLSFNYTETYNQIYVCENGPEMCYIHGKAGDGNIIIGIDEYLKNGKENTDFDFIDFKKYYQRIDKKTGSTYRDWLKTDETKNVYYIGHSFAETDYDILREFLMNDNVKNTILYHIPERKKELIQRVINIITQEELIKRVHGADWTIRFEPQEKFLFGEKNTVFVDSLRSSERELVVR
jgi:hypothetical protein